MGGGRTGYDWLTAICSINFHIEAMLANVTAV